MRKLAALALAVACVGFTVGCGDDDSTGPTGSCEGITGAYAASSFVVTGTSDASLNANLLANDGRFNVGFNGSNFNTTYVKENGVAPVTRTGAFTIADGNITLGSTALFTGAATGDQVFACSLSGNTLKLTAANTTYLFPGTSAAAPAKVTVTLTKISF